MSNLAPELERLQARVYGHHGASDELCALAAGRALDQVRGWRHAVDVEAAAGLSGALEWLDALDALVEGSVSAWLAMPVVEGGPPRYDLLRAGLRAELLAHADRRVSAAYLCEHHHPDWEHVAEAGDGWRIAAQPSGQLTLAPDELEHESDAHS